MRPSRDNGSVTPGGPEAIEVGMGEIVVAESPCRLITPALGSCVGLAIWDPFTLRGGLAHIMLPKPTVAHEDGMRGRFADFAIPELVRLLVETGLSKRRLQAKLAGGAAMFNSEAAVPSIGDRNVVEVRRQLELMSIPVVAEDTGETYARTVEFVLETGEMVVRTYQFGVRRF